MFDILQRKELYSTNTAIIALARNLLKLEGILLVPPAVVSISNALAGINRSVCL